jgi:ATP-dependent RNA helicase RhlE
LPNVPEDYVHRIGRTARAGKSGAAFSLFAPEEHDQLRDIEKTIGAVLACEDHAGFDYAADRLVPDPEREAVPQRQQRPTPGAGRKGRPGGGARRRRRFGSGGGATQGASGNAAS